MQRFFSAVGQTFGKRILIFGLISLLSLSSLFIFANQPALAEKPLRSEKIVALAYSTREVAVTQTEQEYPQESYDEAKKAINEDPKGKGIEEIYDKDLDTFKKENPDKQGVVEGAKKLVDKVTGKE